MAQRQNRMRTRRVSWIADVRKSLCLGMSSLFLNLLFTGLLWFVITVVAYCVLELSLGYGINVGSCRLLSDILSTSLFLKLMIRIMHIIF